MVELFPLLEVASFPPETEALLVTAFVPTAEFAPTATVKLKTLEPLTAIAVVLVQVMTCGEAAFDEQLQSADFAPPIVTAPAAPPLTVKPTGKVSVTVVVPEVAAVPPLLTVKV